MKGIRTLPIHNFPSFSSTSLTALTTFPWLSSNICRSLPSGLYLVTTPWGQPPMWSKNWIFADIGNLSRNFLILGYKANTYAYMVLRQWIATQNSPFSLVLTLSGNPGRMENTSVVPAFSPFNQYLLSLHYWI